MSDSHMKKSISKFLTFPFSITAVNCVVDKIPVCDEREVLNGLPIDGDFAGPFVPQGHFRN